MAKHTQRTQRTQQTTAPKQAAQQDQVLGQAAGPRASRAERALKVATVVLFCTFLAGFGLVTVLSPESEYSATEKRSLTTSEDLSLDLQLDLVLDSTLQDDLISYLSDQFAARSAWVALKTTAEVALGRSEINGVYLGKDGYLIEKYTASDFTSDDGETTAEETIATNTAVLAFFVNRMVEELGADSVRVALVPGKANVLTNYLPDNVETTTIQQQMREALVEQLESAGTVWIDLTDTLQAHQVEYLYYRTDHHWTTLGAYYAYAQIVDSLGLSVADYESYETEVVATDFLGTSYNSSLYYTLADKIVAVHSEAADASTLVAVVDAEEDEEDGDWADDENEDVEDVIVGEEEDEDWADDENEEDVEDVYLDEDGNEISEEDAGDESWDEEDTEAEEELIEYDSIYFEDALEGDDPYLYFMGDNYGQCTVSTGTQNGRTLFLVKDSYANSMIPFLAEQYETIVVFDPRYTSVSVTDCILDALAEGADDADLLVLLSDEKFLMNSYETLLNEEGALELETLLFGDGDGADEEDWDEE